jgi:hypothetical protein
MVLEEGQTQLRFLHVDQREFLLSLIHPQRHRAKLEAVLPNRTIMQEGVPAWVDFQYPATRCDVMVEMIEGLTAQRRPETAWLRRRLRGPMP